MDIKDFVRGIPNFAAKNHPERIKAFGWFLHAHRGVATFSPADVTTCYRDTDLDQPANMGRFLDSLGEKKPPELLKDSRGFRLSQAVREKLDRELGKADVVLVVERMLTELPGKIADEGERLFLIEAITCYRHSAFRATIVMAWNLAYDHLARWVLADPQRLADFNAGISKRNPKKAHVTIKTRDDFEDLKEDEMIDILGYLPGFSGNVKRMLKEKLGRRNTAAHPSTLTIGRSQVDDMITDLVFNVVLAFKL
ncbi:MAG: hypothetical protein ACR2NS_03250 [Gemmatimonadaceae bacterium]